MLRITFTTTMAMMAGKWTVNCWTGSMVSTALVASYSESSNERGHQRWASVFPSVCLSAIMCVFHERKLVVYDNAIYLNSSFGRCYATVGY